MLSALLILTAFAVANGNVISKTSASSDSWVQGNLYKYYHYSINNPMNPVIIPSDISNGANHPLSVNNKKPTLVIVHGHGGDAFTTLNPLIKNELFKGGHDHNVIVVDWSTFTTQSYSVGVAAVPTAGVNLARFLNVLVTQKRISVETLHLVGFNLGAHVVGFAGRYMSTKPARITGLDPSRNEWGTESGRLSTEDALYVEVIHTDTVGILANGIGEAIGHIDFFVNGGSNQPGCFSHRCSHQRAFEVFASSLSRETPMFGNRCTNSLQVSLNTCKGNQAPIGGIEFFKLAQEGVYRVNTKQAFPF